MCFVYAVQIYTESSMACMYVYVCVLVELGVVKYCGTSLKGLLRLRKTSKLRSKTFRPKRSTSIKFYLSKGKPLYYKQKIGFKVSIIEKFHFREVQSI